MTNTNNINILFVEQSGLTSDSVMTTPDNLISTTPNSPPEQSPNVDTFPVSQREGVSLCWVNYSNAFDRVLFTHTHSFTHSHKHSYHFLCLQIDSSKPISMKEFLSYTQRSSKLSGSDGGNIIKLSDVKLGLPAFQINKVKA